MDLTLEAYRSIVKYVGSRADIVTLCGVSKGFRHVAERALYNTLFMRNDDETTILCNTLTVAPRLARHVDALTISASDDENSSHSDSDDYDEDAHPAAPEMNWPAISRALETTTRLRYLNVHISYADRALSWVLDKSTFQLRKFHCEFDWDKALVDFLNRQESLEDLFVMDYRDGQEKSSETTNPVDPPSDLLRIADDSMPKLSILDCTFSEAAMAIVPGRPITHLKTCFSTDELTAKRREMQSLLSRIALSTMSLRSLDIADSSYTDTFSSELLAAIAHTRSPVMAELKHLGTLVLPIDGREVQCLLFLLLKSLELNCVLTPLASPVLWLADALSTYPISGIRGHRVGSAPLIICCITSTCRRIAPLQPLRDSRSLCPGF